jgi:hypothetical protein
MRSSVVYAVLIILIVAGVGTLYVIRVGNPTSANSSRTTSTVTEKTCTDIPAISYLFCPTPLKISAYGTPGATPYGNSTLDEGSWNFTVAISSNFTESGQPILLDANLTNISGQSITIKNFVEPYINPTVSYANGSQVWAWNPPQSTWNNRTFGDGETMHQDVSIPTSQLKQGTYLITVAPISIQFPTPNDYTFTFRVTVGQGSK